MGAQRFAPQQNFSAAAGTKIMLSYNIPQLMPTPGYTAATHAQNYYNSNYQQQGFGNFRKYITNTALPSLYEMCSMLMREWE